MLKMLGEENIKSIAYTGEVNITISPVDPSRSTIRPRNKRICPKSLIAGYCLLIFICLPMNSGRGQAPQDSIPSVTDCTSDWSGYSDSIKTGANLILKINALASLLSEAKSPNQKLVLFLNDMPLKGLYPSSINKLNGQLSFHLIHTDQAKSTWNLLQRIESPSRDVAISVGWEDGYPIRSTVHKMLIVYNVFALICSFVLLALMVVLLLILASRTDILRDAGPTPPDGKRKTFSLARFQMAWWFILVFISMTIIGVVVGELPAFPMSVLGILGIAGGTALGSVAIDLEKPDDSAPTQYSSLATQLDVLRAKIVELKAENPSDPAIPARESEVTTLTKRMRDLEPSVFSCGFLNDILSDNQGINFHRFQVFAWTLFFGTFFLVSAFSALTLKDLDSSWLALMGISSGTYLGLKIPAQRVPNP
ncbi:MAG TPA: hypothetical protein VLX91_01820 [Candidatus Acidoferrales bacterium]|nr:hypothetical protein [Candidatus Acidoferrales bacterium]